MDTYEDILGSERAEMFNQSLEELHTHYHARAQQLEILQQRIEQERQQVTSKLEMVRQLRGDGEGALNPSLDVKQVMLEAAPLFALNQSQVSDIALDHAASSVVAVKPELTIDTLAAEPEVMGVDAHDLPNHLQKPIKRGDRSARQAADELIEEIQAEVKEGDSDLTRLRQPKFRKMTMMEAIAAILRRKEEATHINEIMGELYGKRLGKNDEQRAKRLVNNTLSKGKKEQRWQGIGDRSGLYSIAAE